MVNLLSIILYFPFSPDEASTGAGRVDALFFALLSIAGFFALLIFVLIVYFAIKYRRSARVDRIIKRTDYIKLEVLWVGVPLIISIGIFAWAARLFVDMREPPTDAMEIYVVGKQWMWKIQHPEGNREINELHVPTGRAIKLLMTSQDVIHSFYVPAFRIKQDVLPGRYTTLWFQATKVGEYHLFCAQYCGTGHASMVGKVIVMTPEDYQQWLSGSSTGVSMATGGEQLFDQFGCASCHAPGPGTRGPTLIGLFGKKVTLDDNSTVTADEDYVRESILDPRAKIVKGYQAIMPTTFRQQLTQEQLTQLVEYIKSLSGSEVSATGTTK